MLGPISTIFKVLFSHTTLLGKHYCFNECYMNQNLIFAIESKRLYSQDVHSLYIVFLITLI